MAKSQFQLSSLVAQLWLKKKQFVPHSKSKKHKEKKRKATEDDVKPDVKGNNISALIIKNSKEVLYYL